VDAGQRADLVADVRAAARHDLVTESQASFSAQATQLSGYLAREWTKLLYLALIFCGFSFVLAQVRQRAARWTDQDPALERANRILQLPFATAGVLTFLFCKPIVPEAPRLFWIALATIALVPIVILLRRLIDRHLFPIVNALVVFYVIAQVRALVATLPVLSRAILLLEMIGGAVFLAWFIHSTRAAGNGRPRAERPARRRASASSCSSLSSSPTR
jgi:hypothetical protein